MSWTDSGTVGRLTKVTTWSQWEGEENRVGWDLELMEWIENCRRWIG